MSRRRKTMVEGGVYHVVQRGNRRQAIYLDDRDRDRFTSMLADMHDRLGVLFHAYCLMGNHYHLILETPGGNLNAGMHWLNGVYAVRFNARHAVDGHLFQDRYWASLLPDDASFRESTRYVFRNPVAANLVPHAHDWRWSTYAMALGLTRTPRHVTLTRLMSSFGPAVGLRNARQRLREYIAEAPPDTPQLDALLPDIVLARRHGYTIRQIAAGLGCDPATVSRRLRRVA